MKTTFLVIFGFLFHNGIIFPYLLYNELEKVIINKSLNLDFYNILVYQSVTFIL